MKYLLILLLTGCQSFGNNKPNLPEVRLFCANNQVDTYRAGDSDSYIDIKCKSERIIIR